MVVAGADHISTFGGADFVLGTTNTATGVGSDSFVLVENLIGTGFADTLRGSGEVNSLSGGNAAEWVPPTGFEPALPP